MFRRALPAIALVFATACGGSGTAREPSPPPSGALGPVTQGAATEAVLGLCETEAATERDPAEAAFLNRAHATLHAIAAAAEPVDRGATATLLETKQVVEADLAEPDLPQGFAGDVAALLEATRDALDAIGLEAPACEP